MEGLCFTLHIVPPFFTPFMQQMNLVYFAPYPNKHLEGVHQEVWKAFASHSTLFLPSSHLSCNK